MAGLLDSLKRGLTSVGGALDAGLDKLSKSPASPKLKPVAASQITSVSDVAGKARTAVDKRNQALKDAAGE